MDWKLIQCDKPTSGRALGVSTDSLLNPEAMFIYNLK